MSEASGKMRGADPTDIHAGDWVDRWLPRAAEPYARLARLDRPIGTWLLLFPAWWGIALAAPRWPDPVLLALFALGAVAMRGAGCTLNDIADRDYDGRVARTRMRPLPSGRVTVRQALVFMAAQAALGAAILFSLNRLSILLGLAVIVLIATYPLMKRVTYWPQFQLGGADRLDRRRRHPRPAGGAALSRRDSVDARLRYDLRPPGQGGRRPHRRQILGPVPRRAAHPPVSVCGLCRRRPAVGGGRGGCRARPRLLARARRGGGAACLAGAPGRARRSRRLPGEIPRQPLDRLARPRRDRRRPCRQIATRRPLSAPIPRSRRRRCCRRSACISPAR